MLATHAPAATLAADLRHAELQRRQKFRLPRDRSEDARSGTSSQFMTFSKR
jgi:hypothetical protein